MKNDIEKFIVKLYKLCEAEGLKPSIFYQKSMHRTGNKFCDSIHIVRFEYYIGELLICNTYIVPKAFCNLQAFHEFKKGCSSPYYWTFKSASQEEIIALLNKNNLKSLVNLHLFNVNIEQASSIGLAKQRIVSYFNIRI